MVAGSVMRRRRGVSMCQNVGDLPGTRKTDRVSSLAGSNRYPISLVHSTSSSSSDSSLMVSGTPVLDMPLGMIV